ncbi:MAG: endolytic transglycosylase MltG [Campylobacterota bacterium]|nr:endolytic transglycosylase MltG [Campylobacterota bacterium]
MKLNKIKKILFILSFILSYVIEMIFIFAIIILFYLNQTVETKRVIKIPKGSTSNAILSLNKRYHNINIIDKTVLKYLGHLQGGWIDLKIEKMTKLDFLYKLTTSKAALKKIVLIPGETYFFFLQDLAEKLNVDTFKVFDLYSQKAFKKDGNIMADTYYLPMGMNEKDLINYLINTTNKTYEKLDKKIFGSHNKDNWYRYITIASIIQKEAASKKEMPYISSVIYNRLNKNMKLQMDGILNYSKYSHTKITPKMIKEDTTDYNTYKYKGLPSSPVCAVELAAIKAAIFPAKTDYLYFMKSIDGKSHHFSKTYKQHKRYIKKVKRAKKKAIYKKKKPILNKEDRLKKLFQN